MSNIKYYRTIIDILKNDIGMLKDLMRIIEAKATTPKASTTQKYKPANAQLKLIERKLIEEPTRQSLCTFGEIFRNHKRESQVNRGVKTEIPLSLAWFYTFHPIESEDWHNKFLEKFGGELKRLPVDGVVPKKERVLSRPKNNHQSKSVNKDCFSKYTQETLKRITKIKNILYSSPINIYDIYISPTLHKNVNSFQKHEIPSSETIQYCLRPERRIIIEATAGAGKSLFMKHLFCQASLSATNLYKIPILIELRNVNFDVVDSLASLVFSETSKVDKNITKESVSNGIKDGLFLLLLDGLDEIEGNSFELIKKIYSEVIKEAPQNSIIISSRPNTRASYWDSIILLGIKGLEKKEVLELLGKLKFDKNIKENFIKLTEEELYDRYTSFYKIPLLCTIVLITYANHLRINPIASQFYGDAYSALFRRHDLRKDGYQRKLYSDLEETTFAKVFSYLCFESYIKSHISFSERGILDLIGKSLKKTRQNIKPISFLQDCIEHICLLHMDGNRSTFTHRAFQEFFTAVFISELPEDKAIRSLDIIFEKSHTDIVLFLCREINPLLVDFTWLPVKITNFLDSVMLSNKLDLAKLLDNIFDMRYENYSAQNGVNVKVEVKLNEYTKFIHLINEYNKENEIHINLNRIKDKIDDLISRNEHAKMFFFYKRRESSFVELLNYYPDAPNNMLDQLFPMMRSLLNSVIKFESEISDNSKAYNDNIDKLLNDL